MKKILIIIIIYFFSLQGWTSYVALLHNPTSMHTVALLGDTHGMAHEFKEWEEEFIQQLKIYLNYLITSHLPYHTFLLESNLYQLYNTLFMQANEPISELALIQMLLILSFKPSKLTQEQIPISLEQYTALYTTIRDYLGVFPATHIAITPADNRIAAIQFLTIFDRIVTGQANDLYNSFKQHVPLSSPPFASSIKWIDALFFNAVYQQFLLQQGMTADQLFHWKKLYMEGIIQALKDANVPFTLSIADAQHHIQEEISFMRSLSILLQDSNHPEDVQHFFKKIKEKLEFIATQLTALQTYSPQNPTLLDSLMRFAQHFKTFKAINDPLSIISGRKTNTPLASHLNHPKIIDLNYALYYILTYYADIGFLRLIMAEIVKNNNCFLFAGQSHCEKIEDFLLELGYQLVFTAESNENIPISKNDLSHFINQYFDYCSKKSSYMETLKKPTH